MEFNNEQRKAIEAAGSVAISAAAGTGKTAVLAARYLYHIAHHKLNPLQIVAITFTDKAAAELRNRVRQEVSGAHSLDRYEEIVAELEAAPISTIHSLAARICREHPDFADVPPDFAIMDDLEEKLWMDEHTRAIVSSLPQEIFEKIPYSKISTILTLLLADPYTTTPALLIGCEGWEKLIEKTLDERLVELLKSSDWEETIRSIRQIQGPSTGALVNLQKDVYTEVLRLQAKETRKDALMNLCTFRLFGGKMPSGWNEADYTELKRCLNHVRDIIQNMIGYNKDYPSNPFLDGLSNLDKKLETCLPLLHQLYNLGLDSINAAKREDRLLSFVDLEIHALQALQKPEVQQYYQQRWKAILVDEFQDTNPIQRDTLNHLTSQAILTIVGDEKQSIYGFRRADVTVFAEVRNKILENDGIAVPFSQSYRMHKELAAELNLVFSPTMAELHQDLVSSRIYSQPSPYIHACYIQKDDSESSKDLRRMAEANQVAETIKGLLESGFLVYDKNLSTERPIKPSDIAILSHVRKVLNLHYEALLAWGVECAFAGGGDLLATREAKDARALLGFLADPSDNVTLVATLRSPFFAASDVTLTHFAQKLDKKQSWWNTLSETNPDELAFARSVLGELMGKRKVEPPSRLLQLADRLTGYSAIIANLPNGKRRLADWRGYLAFIMEREYGIGDIFTVVRELERIEKTELTIERPVLAGGNAVTLSTIHKSKGLEWSVVFVVDLGRWDNTQQDDVLIDADIGLAIKVRDENGKLDTPALYQILADKQMEKEDAEARRVLYVALTRARDQIYLSSTDLDEGKLKRLAFGLSNANIEFEAVPFTPENATFTILPATRPETLSSNELISPIQGGLLDISATALSLYSSCAKCFKYQVIEGNPGISEGDGIALRIGSAVHVALESGVKEIEELRRIDPTLDPESLQRVWKLVEVFHTSDQYASFRQTTLDHEIPVVLPFEGFLLHGIADLVGDDWVLDYKTDTNMEPEHHQLQLWIYARALDKDSASIAYLKHNSLYTFTKDDLAKLDNKVRALINRIKAGDFTANPEKVKCEYCLYKDICAEGIVLLGIDKTVD